MTTTTRITRAALAASFFASKDYSRPALSDVWTNRGYYSAADGFAAIQVRPATGPAPDGIAMTGKDAAVALRNTRKHVAEATITTDDDGGHSITTDANPKITYALDQRDAEFHPDIAQLFDDNGKKGEARIVYLHVDLLERLVKAIKTSAEDYAAGMIQFHIRGAHDPVEAHARTLEGDQIRAMLMPMVGGWDRFADTTNEQ